MTTSIAGLRCPGFQQPSNVFVGADGCCGEVPRRPVAITGFGGDDAERCDAPAGRSAGRALP